MRREKTTKTEEERESLAAIAMADRLKKIRSFGERIYLGF